MKEILDIAQICEKMKLDRICAKLRENRGWSAVHVAAAFDLIKCLKDDRMIKYINLQEGELNRTPLHIAIINGNKAAVKTLIDAGAQMDLKDLKGNSIFHCASENSTEILQVINILISLLLLLVFLD